MRRRNKKAQDFKHPFIQKSTLLSILFSVTSSNSLLCPQYVTVQFMWFTAHFLFWDYSQTTPAEEFSVDGVIRFLGNKDTAVYNQFAIWGTVRTPTTIFFSFFVTFYTLLAKKTQSKVARVAVLITQPLTTFFGQ